MAILNTKMGGTDISNGDTPEHTDWNDTFNAVPILDTWSITAMSTTSTAYENKRSVAFAAGEVKNKVLIRGDLMAIFTTGSDVSGNCTSYLELKIDSTQLVEISATNGVTYSGGWLPSFGGTRMFVYEYEPTSLEKSSGFTINLNMKRTVTAGHSGSGQNNCWEVWSY